MSRYSFKWNQPKLKGIKANTIARMLNLGFKTAAEAQHGAPVRSGALINSIRTTTDHKSTVYVLAGGIFAGKNVPYARRREYENNLHPNKKHYMKNAFSWLGKHYAEEFKGVAK